VEQASASGHNGNGVGAKAFDVPIVLASPRQEDREILAGLLEGSAWRLVEANTPDEALAALRQVEIPIILCDPYLGGERWKTMVRSLLSARRGVCVIFLVDGFRGIVLTPAAPSEFDFLVRPFDRDQLFAALFFAYGRCKSSWNAAWLARSHKPLV
jgi:DNA-binding NtrC family response regulator